MKSIIVSVFFLFISISVFSQIDSLRQQINLIIQGKNAIVGVSINIEHGDSLIINGNSFFPLFSVVKFPTAITVLHLVDEKKLSLDSSIHFVKSSLDTFTFSPLRDEISKLEFDLTIRELLNYSLSRSDNIAFEKLVELVGGINVINDYILLLGINDISIKSTAKDGYNAYLKNQSTPFAINQLLIKAYQGNFFSKESYDLLWKTMKDTPTGLNRIKGLLPVSAIVAHKTGSSGVDEKGLSLAFNDVGIVTLPYGKHFAISVFITFSQESDEENAAIIAEISKATWDFAVKKNW